MNKNDRQKNQLQFLACPECNGQGIIERGTCPECNGVGSVAWTGSKLLYWGREISRRQLSLKKTKKLVKNIINILLFISGIAGILAFVQVIFVIVENNLPFWKFYNFRNWQLLIFWLSLVTDSYLFYRFQKDLEKIKHIPKCKFQEQPSSFRSINWGQIKTLEKAEKIDVSDYFTTEALSAIEKAWELTNKYQQIEVGPINLLISLLTFEPIKIIFSRLGISFQSLKTKIVKSLSKQPPWPKSKTVISSETRQILFSAYVLAGELREKKVGITEILQTLVSQKNDVQELLYDLNITTDKLKNVIAWIRIKKQLRENWQRFRHKALLRPKNTMNRSMTAIATPILDTFSQDLTLLARAGYLMPCVDRERESDEIFRIMHGGTRRSAILVGNPGVGRTTIIEGIAQRMIEEDVPDFLQDKRLVSLSISKLVSGASAAEAQQRLTIIINEIERSGNIILFIGDIHNMIGITSGREGTIDLADVLAQAMAENNILCLATTTPGDYRRYIENRSSLENVLEKVSINEVSGNTAIQILEAKTGTIEYQNQVYFSYDAVAETVELSDRYLHDRYLPEKAIEILQEVATKVKDTKGKDALVTANDVALVISEKTNIPLTEITKEESEKLLNLESKIHERIIDQKEAVDIVAASLRRARAEIRDMNRPIVNLLFLGPTGVGKTELAKTVAEVYFGAEQNMIRIDMSEYQDKSSINRLIGAPPGYAQSNEGGYLTEAVRKNPFSLILFDEIEKSHPDVLNLLLQVMDDGRLTDSSGRTVDFTNTIIIGTSNAGTEFIQKNIKAGVQVEKIKELLIDQELGNYFRPEFLNRFDGIVVFKPLSMEDVEKIAKLMLKKIQASLEEKGINLKVTQVALSELARAGFDPSLGARPLRRTIQERVQDALANYLLSGKIKRRDTVILEGGGKIIIEKAKEI